MRRYIRARVPGATYFFTLTLQDRGAHTLLENVDALRQSIVHVKRQRPFTIDAMVVMPDHLHALWTLPAEDADYSLRWLLIKRRFTQAVGTRGIWQPRFWEHLVRDQGDFNRHVDYIHFNPVKHGFVARAADWPHSSFHRYVRAGKLPPDWGVAADIRGSFGE